MNFAGELLTFFRAQLDEDERVARAAEVGIVLSWVEIASAEGDAAEEHIVRWDTARVLAEVEAKRQIVEECALVLAKSAPRSALNDFAWTVLRPLAQPYAGRPGWRAEWRA